MLKNFLMCLQLSKGGNFVLALWGNFFPHIKLICLKVLLTKSMNILLHAYC